MSIAQRKDFIDEAQTTEFDVAIIGGGIAGASLYHYLCQRGHRVLLVDKGDFAAASSQSSGMLVWGGLLYLRNLDFRAVLDFSRARDALIRSRSGWVRPEAMRYIPAEHNGRNKHLMQAALYLYWGMGAFNRRAPSHERNFAERSLLRVKDNVDSLRYEEGMLRDSDARFVLHWITPHQLDGQVPLNYCAVTGGAYNDADETWALMLRDTLDSREVTARARVVVNCSGVWTDEVNQTFGINTPVRHLLSKGVYIGVRRPPEHHSPLIFEMGEHGDVLTLLPWGPVSLWGPTETLVNDIGEGFRPNGEDLAFLLEHAQRNLERPLQRNDIVSLRCGIRPLVVPTSFHKNVYPLDISRRHRIVVDHRRPWISFFGGKLTNCVDVAAQIYASIPRRCLRPPRLNGVAHDVGGDLEMTAFPGLEQAVPSARWCAQHEFCHTLTDYLRRRTNISQWVPREGLGVRDEHLPELERIALDLVGGDRARAAREVSAYRNSVVEGFDRVVDAG